MLEGYTTLAKQNRIWLQTTKCSFQKFKLQLQTAFSKNSTNNHASRLYAEDWDGHGVTCGTDIAPLDRVVGRVRWLPLCLYIFGHGDGK
jgi:hypothetical protein